MFNIVGEWYFRLLTCFSGVLITKFAAKLHAKLFHFSQHMIVPLAKLSLRKFSTSNGGQRFPIRGQRFYTGILNELPLTLLTDGRVLKMDGHWWARWNYYGHW